MSSHTAARLFEPGLVSCAFLLLVVLASGILGYSRYLRRHYAERRASETWPEFILGPGAVQVATLTAGMLLACISSAFPHVAAESLSTSAAVVTMPASNPSAGPVVGDYVDVARFGHLGVLARCAAPDEARAVVIVEGFSKDGQHGVLRRLEVGKEWMIWEASNNSSRVRIITEKSADATAATAAKSVEVTLLLSSEPLATRDTAPRSAPR